MLERSLAELYERCGILPVGELKRVEKAGGLGYTDALGPPVWEGGGLRGFDGCLLSEGHGKRLERRGGGGKSEERIYSGLHI